jgi:predicted RNA-binding Zn-ribbon protein involved in translation (DUF1610 family)
MVTRVVRSSQVVCPRCGKAISSGSGTVHPCGFCLEEIVFRLDVYKTRHERLGVWGRDEQEEDLYA